MLLLLRIVTFVAVLAPGISNAQYPLLSYPIYPPPPSAPQDRARVQENTERYVEEMQRQDESAREYRKRQIEDWRENRKRQIEDWREYRKQQFENWRENRKRQIEKLQRW